MSNHNTELAANNGRQANGRFGQGNTFSRGARPLPENFKKLAEEHSLEALQGIIDDMRNESIEPNLRFKCRELILAYGVGRPKQQVDVDSTSNHVLEVVIGGQLQEWAK